MRYKTHGMRNFVSQEYFSMSLETIWNITVEYFLVFKNTKCLNYFKFRNKIGIALSTRRKIKRTL